VSVRAFIEFRRDSSDGSANRVLPAVYLALKLRSASCLTHTFICYLLNTTLVEFTFGLEKTLAPFVILIS